MTHAIEPAAPDAKAVKAVAADAGAFAADLYGRLAGGDGNLFFSPYSISSALAMTYGGARGNTAKQMAGALHFSLPPGELHPAFAKLMKDLNAGGMVKNQPIYELAVANAIWGQKGYPYQPAFLDLLDKSYGAGVHEVDYLHAAEAARVQINGWVEKQTKEKIKDLLAAGAVGPDTRLVLVNAIYFKGSWAEPFKKEQTQDGPFHVASGTDVTVPLMHEEHSFGYAETDDLQAVELPYAGNKLSMVVLLPKKADGLAALEKNLTREKLDGWLGKLARREVRLDLPRFTMTREFELSQPLKAMGMTDAFGDKADFTGIASVERLAISAVIHKAFVDVNEEGTEAAAATAVTIRAMSARIPDEPVAFRADHPFVFLIRDRQSKAILFLGRLTNPKG